MSPWLTDIGKEVIVALLTAGLSWIGHFVGRLGRDVNASFQKIRDLETRVKCLEHETCEEE